MLPADRRQERTGDIKHPARPAWQCISVLSRELRTSDASPAILYSEHVRVKICNESAELADDYVLPNLGAAGRYFTDLYSRGNSRIKDNPPRCEIDLEVHPPAASSRVSHYLPSFHGRREKLCFRLHAKPLL